MDQEQQNQDKRERPIQAQRVMGQAQIKPKKRKTQIQRLRELAGFKQQPKAVKDLKQVFPLKDYQLFSAARQKIIQEIANTRLQAQGAKRKFQAQLYANLDTFQGNLKDFDPYFQTKTFKDFAKLVSQIFQSYLSSVYIQQFRVSKSRTISIADYLIRRAKGSQLIINLQNKVSQFLQPESFVQGFSLLMQRIFPNQWTYPKQSLVLYLTQPLKRYQQSIITQIKAKQQALTRGVDKKFFQKIKPPNFQNSLTNFLQEQYQKKLLDKYLQDQKFNKRWNAQKGQQWWWNNAAKWIDDSYKNMKFQLVNKAPIYKVVKWMVLEDLNRKNTFINPQFLIEDWTQTYQATKDSMLAKKFLQLNYPIVSIGIKYFRSIAYYQGQNTHKGFKLFYQDKIADEIQANMSLYRQELMERDKEKQVFLKKRMETALDAINWVCMNQLGMRFSKEIVVDGKKQLISDTVVPSYFISGQSAGRILQDGQYVLVIKYRQQHINFFYTDYKQNKFSSQGQSKIVQSWDPFVDIQQQYPVFPPMQSLDEMAQGVSQGHQFRPEMKSGSQPYMQQDHKFIKLRPFPYQKIVYLLLIEAYYRQLQSFRYSVLVNQLRRRNDNTGAIDFLNGAGTIMVKLGFTPQFNVQAPRDVFNIQQDMEIFGMNFVTSQTRRKYIQTQWIQVQMFGRDTVSTRSDFTGFPNVFGSQYQQTMKAPGIMSTIFFLFYETAVILVRRLFQELRTSIYYSYKIESLGQFSVRNFQLLCKPIINLQNIQINQPEWLVDLQAYFQSQANYSFRRNSTWYLFSRIQSIQGQDTRYKDWYIFTMQDKPHQYMRFCFMACLFFLKQKKYIRVFPNVQQIMGMAGRGQMNQMLQYLLDKHGLGYFFKDCPSRYKKGMLQYVLYIQNSHCSLIQNVDVVKRLSQPTINYSQQISFNQRRMKNDINIRMIMNKSSQEIQKMVQDIDQQRQLHFGNRIGKFNLPKTFPYQQPIQLALRPYNLFVDIECFSIQTYTQPCYLVCVVGCTSQLISQGQWSFWDSQYCTSDYNFCKWLYQIVQQHKYTKQQPLNIWTFNGNKYQMSYFLPHLQNLFKVVRVLGDPSNAKAYCLQDGAVFFKDARMLMPSGSLAQLTSARSFNTLMKKMEKDQIDISKMKNQQQVDANKQLIIKYCYLDCLSLMYLVFKFFIKMKELADQIYASRVQKRRQNKLTMHQLTLTQISKCLTAPSLALLLFKRLFLGCTVVNNQPKEWTQIQRNTYSGGVSLVLRHQLNQKCYSFDINSSYPKAMTQKLPWYWSRQYQVGSLTIHALEAHTEIIPDLGFFLLDWFQIPPQVFPFIPVKTQKYGILYPHTYTVPPSQQIGIWGFQIKMFLKPNMFKIRSGCVYVSADISRSKQINAMRDYVEHIYPLKSQQQQASKRNLIKLLLNSLYGKFGQRQFQTSQIYQKGYAQGIQLVNHSFQGRVIQQPQRYIKKTLDTKFSIGVFVRIANFITAKARMQLAQGATLAGLKNVYYCDTDSITINQKGKQNLTLSGLVDSKKLGKWKCQTIYQKGFFIAPKTAMLILSTQNQASVLKQAIPVQVHDKTYYFNVKWKGVPKRMIARNNLVHYIESIRAKFNALYRQIPIPILRPIPLPYMMISERWVKSKTGVKIERFYRTTNIIFKRPLQKDGATKNLVDYIQ